MQIPLALFLTFLIQPVFAAESPLVSFYRSQKSIFPSGQISRPVLENTVLRQEQKPWYRVRWNQKDFELPGEIVLKDVNVTQTLIADKGLTLVSEPSSVAAKTLTLPKKSTLVVLKTDETWAQLLEPQQRIKGWARLADLSAPAEDKGIYVTLLNTFLRKSTTNPGEVLTMIPRYERLTALGIEKTYLKVRYRNTTGFVDLNAVAGRGDFAMWAYHKTKGWLGISHRENGELVTFKKEKLSLDKFIAFAPYNQRGIVTSKLEEEGPSIRSRVEIEENSAHLWNLSLVEGHGQVWWRSEANANLLSKKSSTLGASEITSEELLKREVKSVAFAPKSMKGLASANGIFRTLDGKTWTAIEMFEGKNYPVSIHPEGVWFVGSYRSFDDGKTFEPFIKWDLLAEKIQSKIHKSPPHLRIADIEPMPHSQVRILIDTGVQKLKMQAHFLSHEWKIVQ